jgi:hypothetical protein
MKPGGRRAGLADLPPGGKAFKIAKLQVERIGPDQQEKFVLFFKGEEKQLVLNITRWDAIAEFCSVDSDTWSGKIVVLYPGKTTFGGKVVDCIMVRRPKPPQSTPVSRQPQPEELPVDEDGDPGFQAEDAVEFDEV